MNPAVKTSFFSALSRWLSLGCRAAAIVGLMAFANVGVAGPVVCGEKPIRLAYYEYGFFYFQDGRAAAQGIDRNIGDELAKRSGCKMDVQVLACARIWADLASGDLDMSVSGIQNPDRDKFAWFAHYLSMKNYAVVQSSVAAQGTGAQSFLKNTQWQFGAVRAFKHGAEQDQWLDTLRTNQRVQDSANVETLFKKLREGRIDGLFSQPPVYGKHLSDLGMKKDVVVQDWTPGEKGVPHGLILAKSRFTEAEAKQWQALVQTMRTDGTLKRIYLQYLSAAEVAALLDF